jgi:hypothetical protein
VGDGRIQITVLSDVGEFEPVMFAEGKVGKTEWLAPETGNCDPGELNDEEYVSFEESAQSKPGKVGVGGTIVFRDGTITFGGVADRDTHNGKPSFKGRLAITGGTGRYAGFKGQVDVDNCNPKRWRIDGGP